MFVFIPGSIPPVRFGPGGTDPAEISIPAVTYIYILAAIMNKHWYEYIIHFISKNKRWFLSKLSQCFY